MSDRSLGEALDEFFACVLILFSVDEDTDDKNGRDTPEICGAGVMVGHDDQGPEGGDGEPRVRDGGDTAEEADDFFGIRRAGFPEELDGKEAILEAETFDGDDVRFVWPNSLT